MYGSSSASALAAAIETDIPLQMENQIVVNDYRQMDRILKEERTYLLNMVKKIKRAKCNVLFIQKSILRDAVNDLSLHFLAKLNILCIKDIERDEVEFICKASPLLIYYHTPPRQL